MRLTRRQLVEVAGAATGGALVGGSVERLLSGSAPEGSARATVPFDGDHQAGIVTPPQAHLLFASFDFTGTTGGDLRDLLRAWTQAARSLCRGEAAETADGLPDSGETAELGPQRLTLTFGLGPRLFSGPSLGLAPRRPAALTELPPFTGDELEPSRSGGDIAVQACAESPITTFHAIRTLTALARGAAVPRWSQVGFRAPADKAGSTRNLLGFRDGTHNVQVADPNLLAHNVWASKTEPEWMHGGTYMVVRRIRVRVEHWDGLNVHDQEQVIGRRKRSGAPFGGHRETDPVLPSHTPAASHVIQANPRTPGSASEQMLRRGYSFADGFDERFGEVDAGLFFICFQRDPDAQFVPMQRRLAEHDALSEYTFHTGSGVFAIPPGVTPDGHIGEWIFR